MVNIMDPNTQNPNPNSLNQPPQSPQGLPPQPAEPIPNIPTVPGGVITPQQQPVNSSQWFRSEAPVAPSIQPGVSGPSNLGVMQQPPPAAGQPIQPSPTASNPQPSGKKRLIVAIVTSLIVLGIGVTAYFLLIKSDKKEATPSKQPQSTASPTENSQANSTLTKQKTDNSTPTTIQQEKDAERETDIKALHGQIEAYYAQEGRYPTLANINDANFRKTYLGGLDKETLKDPNGTSNTIAAKPAKNIYSYQPTTSGGAQCDNLSEDCVAYVLTATLDTGGTFTKSNLN
jgi:hypothetical protein